MARLQHNPRPSKSANRPRRPRFCPGYADDYLLGTPLLSEYLEEGLEKFDIRCSDVESAATWPP
jgi:hypothetical protein